MGIGDMARFLSHALITMMLASCFMSGAFAVHTTQGDSPSTRLKHNGPPYRDDDEWGWVLMVGVDESGTAIPPPSLCNAGHPYQRPRMAAQGDSTAPVQAVISSTVALSALCVCYCMCSQGNGCCKRLT